MSERSAARVIETTDLTPIRDITKEDEDWLRQLAKETKTDSLTLKLSRRDKEDAEPIVFFEERFGNWWAGRYIGEVQYRGKTLRIDPRFGMPQLQRWLSRIWGINILSSKGRYEKTNIWLWALIAKLWESRLLAAAKHGLPTSRFDELHFGQTVRGRLQIRLTAGEFSKGRQQLVSSSRNRHIDHRIGGVIIHAFEHLRHELRHLGDERSWLTIRAQNLTNQLRTSIARKEVDAAARSRVPIRYTPITESYRGVVEMSRAISQKRPFSSTAAGSNDVFGVLIDMAEIWELYIYHLLRSALRDVEVIHTGRDRSTNTHLLRSEQTGEMLGRLMPDILILALHTNRPLAILDAKYKTTTLTRERPHGILREDLYQMAAYLSAFGAPGERLNAGLVYPATKDTAGIHALQSKNPWRFFATERQLSFIGLYCQASSSTELQLSEGESAFIGSVQILLEHRLKNGFAA
jgi:5-methylcytosine-specific restriction enzyme subunit McrC